MDNGSTIRAQLLGQSSGPPSFPLVGVQFGPLVAAPTSHPPTLYLVGNIHAREWAAFSVTFGVARHIRDSIGGAVSDPALLSALADTAIVIIPLPNPGAYEHTRSGNRFWRTNLSSSCSGGVDLNRNFETGWSDPLNALGACGSSIYRGPGPNSEPETQILNQVLTGNAFELPQTPIGVISYHSYGGLVLYPDGRGTDCESGESFCWNPDFQILRRMFGDTHDQHASPGLWTFSGGAPYLRGQSTAVLYPVSGSLISHASFQSAVDSRIPAITPELTSVNTLFEYECTVNNPDAFIDDLVMRQLPVINRALSFASKQKDPYASPVALEIGRFASGILTREHTSMSFHDDVRGVFVKPSWLQLSTGSLSGSVNGLNVSYQYGRSGSLYDLYFLDRNTPGWTELCPPCRIETTEGGADESPECAGCVDLCDRSRLIASGGWALNAGPRGPMNRPDCWWTPGDDGSTLELPRSLAPSGASHCHFSVSVDGEPSSSQLVFERQNLVTGSWELLHSRHPPNIAVPWFSTVDATGNPPYRTVTHAFEASQNLSPGEVPGFRVRVVGKAQPSGRTKIFDPIVYCRIGSLP